MSEISREELAGAKTKADLDSSVRRSLASRDVSVSRQTLRRRTTTVFDSDPTDPVIRFDDDPTDPIRSSGGGVIVA